MAPVDPPVPLEELPAKPGVYLFFDEKRRLLYVGKARGLRQRVKSYFQKMDRGPRLSAMVARIRHLEFIVTQTEGEALLLENSLIKNQKPQYNVQLRDDKTYPYIKITDEPFPRVIFTRRAERGGGRLYGPFPSARAARQAIRLMHTHFHIRNCELELGKRSYEPCLQWHMKRCAAPCAFRVEEAEYEEGVARARLFLQGQTHELVEALSTQMRQASQDQAYEKAAYLRDLMGLVSSLQGRQHVANLSLDRVDVLGMAVGPLELCVAILEIRQHALVHTRQFRLDYEPGIEEELASSLCHYYLNHADAPRELLVRDPDRFSLLAEAWPTEATPLALRQPKQGSGERLLRMAEETASHLLEVELPARKADPALAQLAELLDLPGPPMLLECFDISHVQGTFQVAAMVRFEAGRPARKAYRSYRIRTVDGADDFAAMSEVVTRRYRRLQEEQAEWPDLVVVDGGLGQLHAAHMALTRLGLGDLPLIGLAKREEWIYTTASAEPLVLDHSEPALRLLQHARDEAHRRCLGHHRTLRSKAMTRSVLDEVPGMGPVRTRKLLHHFGSMARLRTASLEQLAALLGPALGQRLFHWLREHPG